MRERRQRRPACLGRVGGDHEAATVVAAKADNVALAQAVVAQVELRLLQHVHTSVLRAVGPGLDHEVPICALIVLHRQRVCPAGQLTG